MIPYIRPAIDWPVYRDTDGNVIDYGNRWGGGSPPDHAYSVVTHPERFAPLRDIADALIAYLEQNYNVEVTDNLSVAADLMFESTNVQRALRVTPNDPACAALTFVFTDFPGVILHAGLLHDFVYPTCGCDACDESGETQVDELEKHVLAVVAGDYRETMGRGATPWIEYAIAYSDGAESGRLASVQGITNERIGAARATLRTVRHGWAPWPAR